MDSEANQYTYSSIEKEGEIWVEDFMTEEDDSNGEKVNIDDKEYNALKAKFDFDTILTNLIIKKDKFIIRRPGSINEDYRIEAELGKGAYGCVYRAVNNRTKIARAIKKISKDKINDINRFLFEVETLKQLDHPNVIKLFEIYESQNDVYLVQELCTGGELLDQLIEEKHMSEQKAMKIFKQIIQAILYCNKNGISHRDLKPENFMFASEKEGAVLKLIDFGLARTFYKEELLEYNHIIRMRTRAGTAFFMAPEVILNNYSEA